MNALKLLDEVLKKITPTPNETGEAFNLYSEVKSIIEETLSSLNIKYKVELEGSLIKGTNLKGETDLDIFILLDLKDLTNEWIKKYIIDTLYPVLSKKYHTEVRYASHPYIKIRKGTIEADLVPAYWASEIKEIKTAVDRTPFHTKYVKSRLSNAMKNEVRILKKFFKGIGVYGAEIKVEGFSGYLTELLIIKYGNFLNTLKAITKWRPPQVVVIDDIDYEEKEAIRLFGRVPLIIPDPVDPRRNAAAAVSMKSFSTLIIASHTFLESPSMSYFFPPKYSLKLDELRKQANKSGTAYIGFIIGFDKDLSPDIVWGELKSALKRGENKIKAMDFNLVYSDVWSNNVSKAVILFEVYPKAHSPYALHRGPPAFIRHASKDFLMKYLTDESSMGPWIGSDGRLYVIKKRRFTSPSDVLRFFSGEIVGRKHLKLIKIFENLDNLLLEKELIRSSDFVQWLAVAVVKTPPWVIGSSLTSS